MILDGEIYRLQKFTICKTTASNWSVINFVSLDKINTFNVCTAYHVRLAAFNARTKYKQIHSYILFHSYNIAI